MVNPVLRSLVLLLLAVVTTPLFAQWETRPSLRAGYVLYQAIGFRDQADDSMSPVFGGDVRFRRNRLAVTGGADGYQIKGGGTLFLISADAQYLFGDVDGAHFGIGAGPGFVTGDGESSFTIVPVVNVNFPWRQRQVYVSARYHEASTFPADLNQQTTLLMLGLRFRPFGR